MSNARTQGRDGAIRPQVNPSIWKEIFKKNSLMPCLVEMFKNSIDWNATQIQLDTRDGRDRLRFVDDGAGMNERNRFAFLSVGNTTANSAEQSAKYGTGAKYMIFSFSSNVRVVTAPQDDAEWVFVFEFTPDDLAQAYSGRGEIRVEKVKKTKQTWPHEHPFGTDMTFTYVNPRSSAVVRGDKLARKLSDRLDLTMSGLVKVDGKSLPPKELIGQLYSYDLPQGSLPRLGRVRLELYRPKRKSVDENLFATGRTIGEVPFREALRLLDDDQRELVPELFLDPEVCGLIKAEFLNNHTTESRDSYADTLADDPNMPELLRFLRSVEPDVAAKLQISLTRVPADDRSKQVVTEVVDVLQRRYNPQGELPEGEVGDVVDDPHAARNEEAVKEGTSRVTGTPPPPSNTPRLLMEHEEFEHGEVIDVKLVAPEEFAKRFHWYTDQSRADVLEMDGKRIRLKATSFGRAVIRALVPMTGEKAEATYEIVPKRKFRLSATFLQVEVNSTTTLRAINADKVQGEVVWQIQGSGKIEPRAGNTQVRFTPDRAGETVIIAYDDADPDNKLSCAIRVTGKMTATNAFKIRDRFFSWSIQPNDKREYCKPATIVRDQRDRVHLLLINPRAVGYQAADRKGMLPTVLMQCIAFEYAKAFEVGNMDELMADDIPSVIIDIQNKADQLLAEMMSGI